MSAIDEPEEVCYEGLPVAVEFEELPDGSLVAVYFETMHDNDPPLGDE